MRSRAWPVGALGPPPAGLSPRDSCPAPQPLPQPAAEIRAGPRARPGRERLAQNADAGRQSQRATRWARAAAVGWGLAAKFLAVPDRRPKGWNPTATATPSANRPGAARGFLRPAETKRHSSRRRVVRTKPDRSATRSPRRPPDHVETGE